MLRLWRLVSGTVSSPRNAPSSNSFQVARLESKLLLPIELVILILSYIHNLRDLTNLSLTSRVIRLISVPMIYKTIVIQENGNLQLNYQSQTKLYRSMQYSHIQEMVTTVVVSLARWRTCSAIEKECTCRKLDHQLGDALCSLPNLEVLHFECRLCYKKDLHGYFSRLKTTKLRELSIRCRCSDFMAKKELTINMLNSTAISTVECLGLEWGLPSGTPLEQPSRNILDEQHHLTALNAIYHDGTWLHNALISERPITRIAYFPVSPTDPYNPHSHLNGPRNPFTHIFINNFLSWLPASISTDLQVYIHLQYVGSLHFRSNKPEEILADMKPLASIPNLEGIDVNRCLSEDSGPIQWSASLLNQIRQQHPVLRKIYHCPGAYAVNRCIIWEFNGHWTGRRVRQLSYWDMIISDFEEPKHPYDLPYGAGL